MKIIAVINQKGGCGKTTSCVNIAAAMAMKGKKVLLVDLDPQANATDVFSSGKIEKSLYDVIIDGSPIGDSIAKTELKGLDILPSHIMLSGADLRLTDAIGREKRLKNAMSKGNLDYDYVILDTPPSLSLLTVNALTCANEVFVPINMSYFALQGVKLLEDTIQEVRENMDNPGLTITGVIPTMYNPITTVSKDVEKAIRDYFGEKVFRTRIHINVRLEEAHSNKLTVMTFSPKSKGAIQYMELTEEILNNEYNNQENRNEEQPITPED